MINVEQFVQYQLNNIKDFKSASHRNGAYIALLDTLRYISIHNPEYVQLYMKVSDEYAEQ